MAELPPEFEWRTRWDERVHSVQERLGNTIPPGFVTSFSWKDYILPGACAMTFGPCPGREDFLCMTLGLTQPLQPTDQPYPWEFSVRTKSQAEWAPDLLYQLLTQWFWEKGQMGYGSHLPFQFFNDPNGKMWAAITHDIPEMKPLGTIRGLYLWVDELRLRFHTGTGYFGLLNVVGVTAEEELLANATTPAHLMLLLRRMGISQICDPFRPSVLSLPGAADQWHRIETISHEDALQALQGNT